MKKTFARFYRLLRALLMVTLALAVTLPTLLYIALSIPGVQDRIRQYAERELSDLTGATVTIRDLSIRPFNRAVLRDVAVVQDADTVLTVETLGAGINIYELLLKQRISVNYVAAIAPDLRLSRPSDGAPLNVEPILARLRGDDRKKEPPNIDLRVNTFVLRQGSVTYDVDDAPPTPGRFNTRHLAVSNLRADISMPHLSNNEIDLSLRRLAFEEQSGLEVDNLQFELHANTSCASLSGLALAMPGSLLAFEDIDVKYHGLLEARRLLKRQGLPVALKAGSHIRVADIATLLPELPFVLDPATDLRLGLDSRVSPEFVRVADFSLKSGNGTFALDLQDVSVDNPTDLPALTYSVGSLGITLADIPSMQLKGIPWLQDSRAAMPRSLRLRGDARGNAERGSMTLGAEIDEGSLNIAARYLRDTRGNVIADADITTNALDAAGWAGITDLGPLNLRAKANAVFSSRLRPLSASIEATATDIAWRRAQYDFLSLRADYDDGAITGEAKLADGAGNIDLAFEGERAPDGAVAVTARLVADDVNPYAMCLTDKMEGYTVSGTVDIDLEGTLPYSLVGTVKASDLAIQSKEKGALDLGDILLTATDNEVSQTVSVESRWINGSVNGRFDPAALPRQMAAAFVRAMGLADYPDEEFDSYAASGYDLGVPGRFDFDFTVSDTEVPAEYFGLPMSLVYPMTIEGSVDTTGSGIAMLNIDAPYIRRGNKLMESTSLTLLVDNLSESPSDKLHFTTRTPTADGLMTVTATADGCDGIVNADIAWEIDRAKRYDGRVSLTAAPGIGPNAPLAVVAVNPSEMAFNDSVWNIRPARILVSSLHDITVEDICVERSGQFVKIDGRVSDNPSDTLLVDVQKVNLDYVFESLGIDKVMLGGDATGLVTASQLFSGDPHLLTDGIIVDNISYNGCVFGDAVVRSRWDNNSRAVCLDADIKGRDGRLSKIEGEIYAMSDSLDMRFTAHGIPVGFMETYMSAFASDISGTGYGKARLWGTFKDLDMEGKLFVEDLRLKLNFTNAYFTATDSITLTPGHIMLDNITIADPYGHTALLNGEVRHKYFREPTFEFTVDNARDMLVYDETPKQNPDWYGRLFVNGSASVKGYPDLVSIRVEAASTPGSTFTFVLSDLEEADEYTFLTFRDRNMPVESLLEAKAPDPAMQLVEEIKARLAARAEETSAEYLIELRVDITPDAEIILVMDPVAGDRIRSNGNGNLRMVYTSEAGGDLRMFGTYTLERGTYNFSLQDIIIKDFTIDEGSKIAFTGDPLKARLDIKAVYTLNANLSDLDESFLQDKDLNRTNVPVQALLLVTGDIQEPEIAFDLNFPTLTSDVDRKVRSIISTEEMMNRQIIYLLALNRFYTPDYMSTTKGNELFSVASSTISSQLGNVLGHLSDNLTVSPNLRSDRGDFSDVEVDLALSSRLLNNRLLLNGNFGYRDKSLNTNQFIGDFDAEYLLNRQGTLRLKGYSHYNDENYYLRSAATTQGVGIMVKHEFDNAFSFLRRLARKSKK